MFCAFHSVDRTTFGQAKCGSATGVRSRVADRRDVNELLSLLNLAPRAPGDLEDLPELHLKAVSTRSGPEVLPGLMDAIDRACGWVLHRQMVSPSMLHMRVEVQGRSLMEMYSSLVEQGLELSRESHVVLTERCFCAHLHRGARSGIVTLHMEVQLPAEAPLLGRWWGTRNA